MIRKGINSESYNHDVVTELYDIFETAVEDVQLIKELIIGNGQLNILECFSGTGRILIPLAEDGHKITGIELSPNMVKRSHKKINSLNVNVRKNIEIRNSDVMGGNWGCGYDLIIMGANAFYELPSAESQERCIKLASESLVPGGFLFIDNDDYKGGWEKNDFSKERIVFEARVTDGTYGQYTSQDSSFDEEQNILYYCHKLYTTKPNDEKEFFEFHAQKHPVTAGEVKEWLQKYRFEIIHQFGDRNGSPYTQESRRAIFWAKRLGEIN